MYAHNILDDNVGRNSESTTKKEVVCCSESTILQVENRW
jgi:hypothetical protein